MDGLNMQVQVEAVAKEPRTYQGKISWGIKTPKGQWLSFYRNEAPKKGDVLFVDIKENKGKDGRIFYDAFPAKTPAPFEPPPEVKPATATNGHIAWEDYRQMATAAHSLALDLEPDGHDLQGESSTVVDRSSARAAILNTVMIAFSNGKIALPKEEVIPLPDEDDIPPF